MCKEATVKSWKVSESKYQSLANPEFLEVWYSTIKNIVAANCRKTNKSVRSIEFPANFMEQLSAAISGEKKAKHYRQVCE